MVGTMVSWDLHLVIMRYQINLAIQELLLWADEVVGLTFCFYCSSSSCLTDELITYYCSCIWLWLFVRQCVHITSFGCVTQQHIQKHITTTCMCLLAWLHNYTVCQLFHLHSFISLFFQFMMMLLWDFLKFT